MTKHKRRGNVRWAFAEAIGKHDCPGCEVDAGESCIDRNEEEMAVPCVARLAAYRENIGEEDFAMRHSNPSEELI